MSIGDYIQFKSWKGKVLKVYEDDSVRVELYNYRGIDRVIRDCRKHEIKGAY